MPKTTLNSTIKSYASIVFSLKGMNEKSMDLQFYELPDVNKGITEIAWRGLRAKKEGDSLTYGTFQLKIIIDEYLENWEYIHNWFIRGKSIKTGNVEELNDNARILIFRPDGDIKKLRSVAHLNNIKILAMEKVSFDATDKGIFTTLSATFEVESLDIEIKK